MTMVAVRVARSTLPRALCLRTATCPPSSASSARSRPRSSPARSTPSTRERPAADCLSPAPETTSVAFTAARLTRESTALNLWPPITGQRFSANRIRARWARAGAGSWPRWAGAGRARSRTCLITSGHARNSVSWPLRRTRRETQTTTRRGAVRDDHGPFEIMDGDFGLGRH